MEMKKPRKQAGRELERVAEATSNPPEVEEELRTHDDGQKK